MKIKMNIVSGMFGAITLAIFLATFIVYILSPEITEFHIVMSSFVLFFGSIFALSIIFSMEVGK